MIEWAKLYIEKGYQVVPLSPGTKACKDEAWLKLVFKPEDFDLKDNLGLRSVNGLVVIDEDSPEAVQLADDFLPSTDAIYGRPAKPRSKRLFLSAFPKTVAFKIDNETIIEIRSEHQDLAPPSVHPSGEKLEWVNMGLPSRWKLRYSSGRVVSSPPRSSSRGTTPPPGGRHEWMLALAGTLRQLSLTQPEVERVVVAAAGISGDSKLEDRRTEIRTTFNRPDDDPIKGHKALTEIIGEGGKKFIAALHKIWGGRTSLFLMDAKGERILKDHIDNIAKALGLVNFKAAWDSFAERITITYDGYSGTAEDKYIRRAWFAIDAKFHFRPTKELFWDVVEDIAHQNPYHPVRDYLDGLKWDGEARIDNWLVRAAQAANTPYVHAISSMLLIAAVRRVRRPGAKFDELTVLEGVQGQLKSSALRALCPYDDWFSDDLPLNVDAKQLIERTLGKWVIEASDLSGMSNTQVEHLKGMLARQVDGPVRLAYARMPIERARQFILIGSTNSHTYLTDDTGNRRFWPIRVETFDLKWIRENRDQLWAEASQREASGASIRLHKDLWEHATLQQERRRTKDPWEETITMVFQEDYQRLTPNDIWEALGVPISFRTVAQNSRLGKVLQSIGYSRKTVWKDGKAVMGWGRGQGQRAKQQELTPTSQAVVEEEM